MLVQSTNLDYLLIPLRLHIGDPNSTQFSDPILLTALVNGVKMLASRWSNKYQIYASGIDATCIGYTPNVNDVYRRCTYTFATNSPPIVEQQDEIAITLAAAILLRRSTITSSMSAFSNWATPDLSYSNVQSSRTLLDMLKADQDMLDAFFKGKLGKIQKQVLPIARDSDLLPLSQLPPITPLYVDRVEPTND